MENKNKVWFENFDAGNFDRLVYVEGGHVYYDLIVQEVEGEFRAIPVPIFSEHYLGKKITGSDPDLGHWERVGARVFLNENLGDNYEIINSDDYEEMKREIQTRKENERQLSELTEKEMELLDSIENVGLVLDETINQFGEKIILREIRGNRHDGFEIYEVVCYSSEWLGLGTCQCSSHNTTETRNISIKDVLDKIKRGA